MQALTAHFSPSVDNTVREYVLEENQLTPVCALPPFSGYPWCISIDNDRASVIVSDWRSDDVRVCAREVDGKWSAWRTLARDTHAYICIQCMCLMGSNTLALFEQSSESLLLYEFV